MTRAKDRDGIQRLGEQRYRIWYTERSTGQRRGPVFHGDLEAAKAERAAILDAQARGEYVTPDGQTLGEWLDVWLAHVKRTGSASPRRREKIDDVTYAHYASSLGGTIRERLGRVKLQELTWKHLDDYHDWCLEHEVTRLGTPISPNTLRKRHMALKLALDHALRKQLIKSNAADLTAPPAAVKPRRVAFTLEDVGKILDATAGTDLELKVVLALRTGLRLGEVLGVKWANLDLKTRTLKVETTVSETPTLRLKPFPKTSSSRASVQIGAELAERLAAHKRHQAERRQLIRAEVAALLPQDSPAELVQAAHEAAWQDNDLVFCGPRGQLLRPSDVSEAFTALIRPLEKHVEPGKRLGTKGGTFHSLRHTHATHLVAAGHSIDKVQRRMRHASSQITMDFYLHNQPGQDDDLADTAEELFTPCNGSQLHTECTREDLRKAL